MQAPLDVLSSADLVKVIVPAVTGAAIALMSAWLTSRFTRSRERAQWLWQKEFEVVAEVEQLTGTLTDRLSSWGTVPDWGSLLGQLAQLSLLTGRFHRHPKMQQVLKDFHNSAARIVTDRGVFPSAQDRDTAVKELRARCDQLFEESRRILVP